MIEPLVRTLAGNPILTLFVVIGLGYLAGELRTLTDQPAVARIDLDRSELGDVVRVVTFGVSLGTILVGHKFLKIPFDSLMGLVSGLQTQPASLAYASSLTRSDAPNVAYAGVYPVAMIAKIVLAQLLISG